MIVIILKSMDSGSSMDSIMWQIFPTLIARPVVPWATGVTWHWLPLPGQWFTVAVDRRELVPLTRGQRDHCLQICLVPGSPYVIEACLFLTLLSRATALGGQRKQLGESNFTDDCYGII